MIPSITLVLQSKVVRPGLILWTISVRGSSILLSLATPAQRYIMEKKVKVVFVEIGGKVYEEYDGLSKHRG